MSIFVAIAGVGFALAFAMMVLYLLNDLLPEYKYRFHVDDYLHIAGIFGIAVICLSLIAGALVSFLRSIP